MNPSGALIGAHQGLAKDGLTFEPYDLESKELVEKTCKDVKVVSF